VVITKIISTGAFGPETASLDVAIKLKIPYGGFSPKADDPKLVSRFKLTEQTFESPLDCAKANIQISDGTLIFTRGEPDEDIRQLIDYANECEHPIRRIDFLQTSPIQAVYDIGIWWARHSIDTVHVTGSDDPDLYHEVYESLYSLFVLGMEEAPESGKPSLFRNPIPRTVDVAVQYLMDELPLKDKVRIANMNADEVEDLHFRLGVFIRNRFGLWEGNPHLLLDCAEDAGQDIQHADEASAVILGRLALELEKTHKLRKV
jgi:hypothetical protein